MFDLNKVLACVCLRLLKDAPTRLRCLHALENACDRLEGKYGFHSVLLSSTGGSENTGSDDRTVNPTAFATFSCLDFHDRNESIATAASATCLVLFGVLVGWM
jgi:hypothetical protein